MLHLLLCDDEQPVLDQLSDYLRRTPCADELETSYFLSGEALLQSPACATADLAVLDISMGGISGLETARLLREKNPHICLIFLTTMVQCALEGYDVHAWAFLPKPVTFERFSACIHEAAERLLQQKGRILQLKNGTETDRLNSNEILYVDVLDHTVRIVTAGAEKSYYIRLAAIEQQLERQGFLRCHRSFLVNYRHIRSIRQDHLVMSNGDTVPLSKHRRAEFLLRFSTLVNGEVER